MMEQQANAGWADRLGPTPRITLIVVTATLGLLAVAMLAGYSYAFIEHGHLPNTPRAYFKFAVMVGLVALFGWLVTKLIRSIRPETMSYFDRRYWKMWAIVVGLSIPIGVMVAVIGLSKKEDPFSMALSNSPIAPLTAIVGAVVLVTILIASVVIYFRAIDDHEERAYLWGSNVAFHFLALAFPLHWLLARGGLVPALTIGTALLLVLASCVLQAIVWALFKFR